MLSHHPNLQQGCSGDLACNTQGVCLSLSQQEFSLALGSFLLQLNSSPEKAILILQTTTDLGTPQKNNNPPAHQKKKQTKKTKPAQQLSGVFTSDQIWGRDRCYTSISSLELTCPARKSKITLSIFQVGLHQGGLDETGGCLGGMTDCPSNPPPFLPPKAGMFESKQALATMVWCTRLGVPSVL